MKNDLTIIGRTATASFPEEGITDVPVKVDTGAHSSAIWASELHMDDDGTLHFVLFAKGSPYYSGKVHTTNDYDVRLVRSSNGTTQVRYRVRLRIHVAGRRVVGKFTLADRSKNAFPVLAGCRFLTGKFLVDVSMDKYQTVEERFEQSESLTAELRAHPKQFFEKYHLGNERGDIEL